MVEPMEMAVFEMTCDNNVDPLRAIEAHSRQRWNLVPERWRFRCLSHLKAEMEKNSASRDILEGWRTAKRNGVSIRSTDSFFHFGVGLWVRSTLRHVLPDSNITDQSTPVVNWDDVYMGALDELVSLPQDFDKSRTV
jgi:hypothetical protein